MIKHVLYSNFSEKLENRPSHELASGAFDQAIEQCREAKFKKILLRGDTDFSLTENFDRWDNDGVNFIFGYDAKPNLEDIADNLPESAWKRLRRRSSPTPQSARRSRPENHKEAFVIDHEYESLHQKSEEIAEFSYRPGKCNRDYRMVVFAPLKPLLNEVHHAESFFLDARVSLARTD